MGLLGRSKPRGRDDNLERWDRYLNHVDHPNVRSDHISRNSLWTT